MAKIDRRGFIEDGSSGLSVEGGVSAGGLAVPAGGVVAGASPGALPTQATLPNGANTTIALAGFYLYSGGTNGAVSSCTGTLPSAAAFPGAFVTVAPVAGTGGGMLLTGSAPAGAGSVFTFPSGSYGQDSSFAITGGKFTLASSGSATLQSNSYNWMIISGVGANKLNA